MRSPRHRRSLPAAAAVVVAGIGLAVVPAASASAQARRDIPFSKEILPIFERRCLNCHGGADARSGLKLDSFDSVLQGGAKGQIVVPGNPDESRLVKYIEGTLMPRMPQGGTPLTREDTLRIRTWIRQGAKNDADEMNVVRAADKPLQVLAPKEGATVREKVKILVPPTSIPPGGFVSIYIDDRFQTALAPASPEEREEQGLKPDAPIEFIWNTKAPIVDSTSVARDERYPADGPHVIEVRSFSSDGNQVEAVKINVTLGNKVITQSNQPVQLWYNAPTVGQQYVLKHDVDFEATAADTAYRGFGNRPAPSASGGPSSISHKETSRYLVSLEDITPATGVAFWRERRESPILVTVSGTKQIVRPEVNSRYYSMTRRGDVLKTRLMEREGRVPIINPVELPGRPHRMNEPFNSEVRVHMGAYIPNAIKIERVEARLLGKEWQNNEECAVIALTYLAGNSTLDINSVGIRGAKLEVTEGTTTVWFSERTKRVLRAKHEIKGNLVVDVGQLGGAGGGIPGGSGGEFGPGGSGYPAPGGIPGGSGYPAPGGMPGGSGYPAPGGLGSGSGYPAPGGLGSGSGYPAPGGLGSGSGYPAPGGLGSGSGYPAPGGLGSGSGYPAPGGLGSGSGYPGGEFGSGGGGAIGGLEPTTKRYHVVLKVNTELDTSDPAKKDVRTANR